MAEGDAVIANNLKEQLLKKTMDFVNDSFKMALFTATYTWTPDGADLAYSATNEISAANYTAGGKLLTGLAVTQDDALDLAKWDGNDVSWTALGAASPRHAILYDDTTATKWVVGHWELATDSNGGDYTLQFNTAGIMTVS